ncbi:hypothetical protein GCM10008107_29040 [Psychrosphaera saromensis]|uniref:Porin domain-containing protein n=1 Tax=Psychrosphaera saromensis TaxID=716813 RepID=A0A2S7USN2_9GAMM|nr:porin [Psychrosphaera saromensis]PQJ52953.1 hypothetical protein BTO11_04310 [Psychrosphaera saromensis]GHB77648.1 hypothetical protein GCM10008107_29040 [Psychrosphaera saromensis]GLQ12889.1 hypothetical protein GCM10007917_03440 [Psychrosphaera saromensis]
MKNTLVAAIIVVLGATSTSALAADTKINGFASVVAGIMSDPDTELFGYSDKMSFKPESLFALQITSDLTESVTATAQIMSRGENDYSAEFEWVYLSYEISDSSQLNIGRLRIPFYRYSDFLDVGYAYNWVRPPSTVYNLDFTSYDGVSYVYSSTIGDVDSTLQLIAGSHNSVIDGDPSELDSLMGVNWTLNYDWLTARVAYFGADVSVEVGASAPLITALTSVGLNNDASNIEIADDYGDFLALGLSVDYNNFLVDFEIISVAVENSIFAEQNSAYLSLGYRFDELTLLATIENRNDEHDDSRYGQISSAYGVLGPTVDSVLKSRKIKQDIVSLGARYNFHPSAALKFDYTNSETNKEARESSLSVGVDLVF